MKILYLSTVSSWTDGHTDRYLKSLAGAGHTCLAVAVGGPGGGPKWHALRPVTCSFWRNCSAAGLLAATVQRLRNSFEAFLAALPMDFDVVLCSEPDSWIIALTLKAVKGVKVVVHIREVYEDRASAFPRILRPLLRRLFQMSFRVFSVCTDRVIHVSAERARLYRYLPAPATTVGLYPHSAANVTPAGSRTAADRPLTLLHLGALRGTYAADELIEALCRLRDAGHRFRMIAVGGTAGPIGRQSELDGLVRQGLVELTQQVGHARAQKYLEQADIGLSLVLPVDATHEFAQPRKLYEYMRAGVAVIGSNVPTIRSVVESSGCGVAVDASEPGQLAAAIADLASEPERRREMGLRGVSACLTQYNWETQEPKLLAVFDSLASPASPAGLRSERAYTE